MPAQGGETILLNLRPDGGPCGAPAGGSRAGRQACPVQQSRAGDAAPLGVMTDCRGGPSLTWPPPASPPQALAPEGGEEVQLVHEGAWGVKPQAPQGEYSMFMKSSYEDASVRSMSLIASSSSCYVLRRTRESPQGIPVHYSAGEQPKCFQASDASVPLGLVPALSGARPAPPERAQRPSW